MSKMINVKTFQLILHFLDKIQFNFGVKKLAKLMYFVDFTAYEYSKIPITNETYIKYQFGPMPKRFYSIIDTMKDKKLISYTPQKQDFIPADIKSKVKPDYSIFSNTELKIINWVTEKYKLLTAAELEKQAKSEPPYIMVDFGEDIPYHLAFYRNSFGEMELNDHANASTSPGV